MARSGITDHGSRIVDCGLIALLFAVYAASPPPDVNEAHYLTKARQFWQPEWLPQDLFLTSSFAHLLFYFSFGWLTTVFDFDKAAWVGRIVAWLLLAVGWESLTTAMRMARWQKILSALGVAVLIQWGNLSGEWMLGGIEAKVPAYGLVILSLSFAVRNRWQHVWWLVGLAAAFHLLVGAWSALILIFMRWECRRHVATDYRESTLAICGLSIAALAAISSIQMDVETPWATRQIAAEIQVRERLSHHLYFWDFERERIASFAVLLLLWQGVSRPFRTAGHRLIHRFATGSLYWVALGIALSCLSRADLHSDTAHSLLRLYWFRLADVAVPIATAIAGMEWLSRRFILDAGEHAKIGCRERFRVGFAATIVLAIGTLWISHPIRQWSDGRPGADRQSLPAYPDDVQRTKDTQRNWVRVCDWIRDNTLRSASFVTPLEQQTFKWYAGRAEFANWKDAPQNADALLEWQRRMRLLQTPAWGSMEYFLFDERSRRNWLPEGQVDYIVMPQAVWKELGPAQHDAYFRQVYPDEPEKQSTYVVLGLAPMRPTRERPSEMNLELVK